MTDIERFDDIVRTERYFTATLLPAILLHDGGVRAFLDLLVGHEKRYEEPTGFGQRQTAASTFASDQPEIITEFHVKRDLDFYRKLHARRKIPPTNVEAEKEKHVVPDLVIIAGDEMVVCEGKFFGGMQPSDMQKLNEQLESQRNQVKHLLEVRPLRTYRHVAILPIKPTRAQVDCSGVITWDDIARLSSEVLGTTHYVTRRLQVAMGYWRRINGDPEQEPAGPKYFTGVLRLEDLLEECRTKGDGILVGHRDGEVGLQRCTFEYAESKWWHYRDTSDKSLGGYVRKNWIAGKRFLELIEELSITGRTPDPEKRSARRWYSGLLPLEDLLEKCRAEGDTILVGHGDGEVGLQRCTFEYAESKWWHYRDTSDKSLGGYVPKNWIAGKRFLDTIEELRKKARPPR